PIPEIAVNGENCFRNSFDMLGRREPENIRHARKSLGIPMAHAHATAGEHVVPNQLSLLLDRDETKIVRENIDVVQRRDDEGHFEFSRQISLAVERIDKIFFLLEVQLLTLHPNLVI